jgi:hypothetical protein
MQIATSFNIILDDHAGIVNIKMYTVTSECGFNLAHD